MPPSLNSKELLRGKSKHCQIFQVFLGYTFL